MEEKEWHKAYADEKMEYEEDTVAPAPDCFETGGCDDAYHAEGEDADDYHSSCEALVENACLNEVVHVPDCVEK